MSTENTTANNTVARYIVIAALVAVAFFTSYRFANAASGAQPAFNDNVSAQYASDSAAAGSGCGGSGGGCCGGGGSGEAIEGAAVLDADGIQRISVDATTGYNPNVIKLAAGVPAEITFSEAYGCLGQVMSRDLNFFEDLQTGSKTVSLPALEAGTYSFSCGMEMVFGSIVVE